MAKQLEMPKLSPTMEEGVLTKWHKKEGDEVGIDDLLAEVETDKATMEFRSFDKGTLLKLLVPEGAKVLLGQPVALLGAPGEKAEAPAEAPAAPAAADPPAAAAEPPAPAPEQPPAPAAEAHSEAPKAQRNPQPAAPPQPRAPRTSNLDRTSYEPEPAAAAPVAGGRILASPYVRKAARDRGIDLQGASGSGPGGRVVAQDLDKLGTRSDPPAPTQASSQQPQTQALAPATTRAPEATSGLAAPETRALSMMRKTIARRLTEAKQKVPHFYLTIDVDARQLVELRETINRELEDSSPPRRGGEDDAPPTKISVNDLLVKACAVALVRVPECNAQFAGDSILVHRRVDISVAVAIPDGLVTPVVRNADGKSVVAIAREIRDLAGRARAKKLRPEEMQDGTFSISNLGMFGIDEFSAVINPPEGAILAVGRVREEPAVIDGTVGVGKRMSMTLSCDHRVIDGAVGAAFLAELRALIEHPLRVLTG